MRRYDFDETVNTFGWQWSLRLWWREYSTWILSCVVVSIVLLFALFVYPAIHTVGEGRASKVLQSNGLEPRSFEGWMPFSGCYTDYNTRFTAVDNHGTVIRGHVCCRYMMMGGCDIITD